MARRRTRSQEETTVESTELTESLRIDMNASILFGGLFQREVSCRFSPSKMSIRLHRKSKRRYAYMNLSLDDLDDLRGSRVSDEQFLLVIKIKPKEIQRILHSVQQIKEISEGDVEPRGFQLLMDSPVAEEGKISSFRWAQLDRDFLNNRLVRIPRERASFLVKEFEAKLPGNTPVANPPDPIPDPSLTGPVENPPPPRINWQTVLVRVVDEFPSDVVFLESSPFRILKTSETSGESQCLRTGSLRIFARIEQLAPENGIKMDGTFGVDGGEQVSEIGEGLAAAEEGAFAEVPQKSPTEGPVSISVVQLDRSPMDAGEAITEAVIASQTIEEAETTDPLQNRPEVDTAVGEDVPTIDEVDESNDRLQKAEALCEDIPIDTADGESETSPEIAEIGDSECLMATKETVGEPGIPEESEEKPQSPEGDLPKPETERIEPSSATEATDESRPELEEPQSTVGHLEEFNEEAEVSPVAEDMIQASSEAGDVSDPPIPMDDDSGMCNEEMDPAEGELIGSEGARVEVDDSTVVETVEGNPVETLEVREQIEEVDGLSDCKTEDNQEPVSRCEKDEVAVDCGVCERHAAEDSASSEVVADLEMGQLVSTEVREGVSEVPIDLSLEVGRQAVICESEKVPVVSPPPRKDPEVLEVMENEEMVAAAITIEESRAMSPVKRRRSLRSARSRSGKCKSIDTEVIEQLAATSQEFSLMTGMEPVLRIPRLEDQIRARLSDCSIGEDVLAIYIRTLDESTSDGESRVCKRQRTQRGENDCVGTEPKNEDQINILDVELVGNEQDGVRMEVVDLESCQEPEKVTGEEDRVENPPTGDVTQEGIVEAPAPKVTKRGRKPKRRSTAIKKNGSACNKTIATSSQDDSLHNVPGTDENIERGSEGIELRSDGKLESGPTPANSAKMIGHPVESPATPETLTASESLAIDDGALGKNGRAERVSVITRRKRELETTSEEGTQDGRVLHEGLALQLINAKATKSRTQSTPKKLKQAGTVVSVEDTTEKENENVKRPTDDSFNHEQSLSAFLDRLRASVSPGGTSRKLSLSSDDTVILSSPEPPSFESNSDPRPMSPNEFNDKLRSRVAEELATQISKFRDRVTNEGFPLLRPQDYCNRPHDFHCPGINCNKGFYMEWGLIHHLYECAEFGGRCVSPF